MAMKPTDQEIGMLYKEGGASGPSEALDRSILLAARTAVETSARKETWWRRWRIPLQALAATGLVLTVTVLVERQEPTQPAIPPLAMNDKSLDAQSGPAAPAATSPAPAVAESRSSLAEPAPARTRSAAKQAISAPAPVPAEPAQYPAAAKIELPASAPAGNTVVAEAAPTHARSEAGAAPSAKAAARMADENTASPGEWLESIELLIAQNRLREARKRLQAFVRAFPDEPVPEAIKARLKTVSEGERPDKP